MSSIGGAIWTIEAATAASVAIQAARANATDQEIADTQTSGPYRPLQWQDAPLVAITVPQGTSTSVTDSGDSASQIGQSGTLFRVNSFEQTTTTANPPVILVFDAVIRTEHQQRITKTQHPIQTGANISDHAFIEPARVVLEIGMSDAMDSFYPGQWTGDNSKSVNAYQTLKQIATDRAVNGPLTVTTRLNTYTNMLLTDISSSDSADTLFGLKAVVVFEELLTGTVTSQQVSALPDATNTTNVGNKTGLPVPPSISNEFQNSAPTMVPDAGPWSSNPTN